MLMSVVNGALIPRLKKKSKLKIVRSQTARWYDSEKRSFICGFRSYSSRLTGFPRFVYRPSACSTGNWTGFRFGPDDGNGSETFASGRPLSGAATFVTVEYPVY